MRKEWGRLGPLSLRVARSYFIDLRTIGEQAARLQESRHITLAAVEAVYILRPCIEIRSLDIDARLRKVVKDSLHSRCRSPCTDLLCSHDALSQEPAAT